MLIKEREVPLDVTCSEALLRMLPKTHPATAKVLRNVKNRLKGYRGEKDSDYYAQLLPLDQFFILHDLRLVHHGLAFQIDTLLITTRLILIVEIKNLGGELFFNGDTGQLTISRNETLTGADNPLVQAKNHCEQLKGWLLAKKFPPLPMEYIAVISGRDSVINCSGRAVARRIGTPKSLPSKIQEFASLYKGELLTKDTALKMARLLKKSHSPNPISILEELNIKPGELMVGIPCTRCGTRPMKRWKARWHCSQCGETSKRAHERVILDYILVVKPTISNRECRSLLCLESPRIAKLLLHSMHLEPIGTTKGRAYFLPGKRKTNKSQEKTPGMCRTL